MSTSNIGVDFANHNYAFTSFQTRYRTLCQEISLLERRKISQVLKKVKSFIMEYLVYVVTKDVKHTFIDSLNEIRMELERDIEFNRLCTIRDKSNTQEIYFNQRFYYYFVRLCRILGLFGDELSSSLNANRTDRKKVVKYSTNQPFFEQFTYYKGEASLKLSDFNIRSFKDSFCHFIGFYFAYYLFIDDSTRFSCEKVFSQILSIYLNENILKLCLEVPNSINNDKRTLLSNIDFELHNALTNIFFRVNKSYSEYGIMPRVEEPIYIDTTGI